MTLGKRGILSFLVNFNPEDMSLVLQKVVTKGFRMKPQSRRQGQEIKQN